MSKKLNNDDFRSWLNDECTEYFLKLILSFKDEWLESLSHLEEVGDQLTKKFYTIQGSVDALQTCIDTAKHLAAKGEEHHE